MTQFCPRGKNIPFRAAFCAVFATLLAFPPTGLPQAVPPAISTVTPTQGGIAARTKTGIDVLEEQKFAPLRGKHVALVTNQTGVDSKGKRTIDILAHAPGIKLVALLSPEHGLGGTADAQVANGTDAATHLPVYSLYGDARRPTGAMLNGADALVFDIQDAGVRFYTYVTTMGYCMEAAAQHHMSFFVLDRPNPLGGEFIEGPMLDPDRTSFTGYFPMPVRYAMTLGELARMFNAENKIGADLHVISMTNWRRDEIYSQTGLQWIPPSPNLRDPDADFFYPGVEILQAGGISVGRGTDAPFEILGSPWVRADDLTAVLARRKIPGVAFAPAQFTPAATATQNPYAGIACQGVTITLTVPVMERGGFQSMRLGLELADVLHQLYPGQFQIEKIITLLGSQSTLDRLERSDAPADIIAGWSADLDRFRAMRAKYLLYD
jgi:uncharacterized protein YbbC (DUF1343 family)